MVKPWGTPRIYHFHFNVWWRFWSALESVFNLAGGDTNEEGWWSQAFKCSLVGSLVKVNVSTVKLGIIQVFFMCWLHWNALSSEPLKFIRLYMKERRRVWLSWYATKCSWFSLQTPCGNTDIILIQLHQYHIHGELSKCHFLWQRGYGRELTALTTWKMTWTHSSVTVKDVKMNRKHVGMLLLPSNLFM